MEIISFFELVRQSLQNFFAVDWSAVNYRQEYFSFRAGFFLAGLFFIKIIIRFYRRKYKSVYYHTGFDVDKQNRPGFLHRIIRLSVFGLVLGGTCFVLVALADPYLIVGQQTEQIELREIVWARDASASMGYRSKNTNLSRADVTQSVIFNVMTKRKGKGDRTAYVVFGTEASVWSGFTTSLESILFTAGMAPRIFAPPEAAKFWPDVFIAKEFDKSIDGGDTNLHLGLQRVIYLFDKKGSPEITAAMAGNPNARMRSVIIVTDGAATQDPEPQFMELRKRRIIPYLIFIDPGREAELKIFGENSIRVQMPSQLLLMVRRYGGQYFFASGRDSADKISATIDRLHTIKKTVPTKSKEDDIYYIPLVLACFMYMAAILLRLVTWRFWRVV